MKKIAKKMTVSTLAAGVAVVGFSASASAATETGETGATINGGSLSIENLSMSSFAETTLDGSIQTLTTNIDDYSVVDSTGSGSGWQLNVDADPLTNENEYALPANSLSMNAPSVSAGEGSSSSDALSIQAGEIDSGDDTGVNILSAEADEGMGTFTVSDTELSLDLEPKDAKEGTYTSTVTFSLVSGPST